MKAGRWRSESKRHSVAADDRTVIWWREQEKEVWGKQDGGSVQEPLLARKHSASSEAIPGQTRSMLTPELAAITVASTASVVISTAVPFSAWLPTVRVLVAAAVPVSRPLSAPVAATSVSLPISVSSRVTMTVRPASAVVPTIRVSAIGVPILFSI